MIDSSSSPCLLPVLKGLLVFTWVWCLHLLSLTLCPSPDTTCFYYNSIIPLVLIKYSVCSKPLSHQKWIQPHLCLRLSVLLFFPFTAFWSCLLSFCLSHFSTHLACVCGVCMRGMHLCQMHFSGSAAFRCQHHYLCHTWQLLCKKYQHTAFPLSVLMPPSSVTMWHCATSLNMRC